MAIRDDMKPQILHMLGGRHAWGHGTTLRSAGTDHNVALSSTQLGVRVCTVDLIHVEAVNA